MLKLNPSNCPICGQGQMIAMRDGDDHTLILMCDECESQWAHIDGFLNGEQAILDEATNITFATQADLVKAGWDRYSWDDETL